MNERLKFVLENWKNILLGVLAIFVIWAFMPNCATRKGMEAAAEAKAAIELANQHKEKADAAEKAALEEASKRFEAQKEREVLAKDKADLTAQVARLRKALPPRPVVGPGTGVPGSSPAMDVGGVEGGPTTDASLVAQLYDVIDAQAALIAKHEEDDRKEAELIASLEKSEAKWREAAETRGQETEDLRRALRAKEIRVDAMKWAGIKDQARAGIAGAILWEVLRSSVLRKR